MENFETTESPTGQGLETSGPEMLGAADAPRSSSSAIKEVDNEGDVRSEKTSAAMTSETSDEDDDEQFFDLSPAEFIVESVTNESIDRLEALILRQRLEQAVELRALQFSSRLVSGAESRNRLERFFNRNNPTADVQASSSHEDTDSPSATSPSSSEIRNELEQLRSQQRVANVLFSSRDEIERTLSNIRQRSSNPRSQSDTPRQTNAPRIRTDVSERPDTTAAPRFFSIEAITREQVLSEMNELVNQQLVSSLLNSTFPSRLEQSILNRMRASGGQQQTERPRIVIERRSQLPSGALRNSRELVELRDEINELKSLVKLSFEMQMGMQRAFKQEISALISGRLDDVSSSRLVSSQRPVEQGKCVICVEKQIDSVLYACGHMCACFVCSMNLKQKSHNCPVCRAPIQDIVRVYQTNLD